MPVRHPHRGGRRRARIAGLVGTLAAMLAFPDPDGEQSGEITVMFNMNEYIFYAARAWEDGVKDFGDTTVGIPGALYADPPPSVVANYSRRMLGGAQDAGVALDCFYAGKTSVYAADPYDPRQWYQESLRRFRQHRLAAAGYRFTFVAAVYASEDDALAAEKFLVTELGAAAGLASLNSLPYRKGQTSKRAADGYVVYLQAQ